MKTKLSNWQIALYEILIIAACMGYAKLVHGNWTAGLSVLVGMSFVPFALAISAELAADEECPIGPVKKMTPATRKRIKNLAIVGMCCFAVVLALDIFLMNR